MTIVYHDDWSTKKGPQDARRHQKKIDEAIRKNVRDVIGTENIITKEDGKKVRVPVKGLKDYRFIHGQTGEGSGGGGIGQGDGKPGDVIGRRQKQGQGGRGSKEGHGDGDMEVEVDIDQLIDVMMEDLGLPWLDPKKKNSIEIPKGWKFESISKKGTFARIHKKRTMREAAKRNIMYVKEVMDQTGCSYEDACKALQQGKGDIMEAVRIINDGELNGNEATGFLVHDDDLRYKQIEEEKEICSKAVVFAMMDVSGSMTSDKKYLVKSLLFWMINFLRKQYESVEIRFIQHTDRALEVDEDTFFYGGETGGTVSKTAFEKANYIIDTEYPLDEWNIYAVYCSDGEDWEPKDTVSVMEDMIKKKINMISYVEIKPYHDMFNQDLQFEYGYSTLLPECLKKWKFQESNLSKDGKFWINNDLHFLLSVIKDKSHIWPCLQHMLSLHHPEREESNAK